MREIKFRAWDIGDKSMVDDYAETYYFETYGFNSEYLHVMQYTGLKDKNGVEIYDNDIFEAEGIIYRIEWVQEYLQYCIFTQQHWVWFQEGSNHFKYCHQHDSDGRIYFLHQLESYEIEVIGNIHQNPELLREDTK